MAQRYDELIADSITATKQLLGAMAVVPMVGRAAIAAVGPAQRTWYTVIGGQIAGGGGIIATGGASAGMFIPYFANAATKQTASIYLAILVSGGAGSIFRLGVYDSEPSSLLPSSLLFDSGVQDGTVVASAIVPMGLTMVSGHVYWLAYKCEVGAPTVRTLAGQSNGIVNGCYGVDATSNSAALVGVFNGAQGAGPFAAQFTTTSFKQASNNQQIAAVGVEFA